MAIIRFQRLDPAYFSSDPRTDFEQLFAKNDAELKTKVGELFDQDMLLHEFSKAYDTSARFPDYFKKYQASWHLVDLNMDGTNELLFSGLTSSFD